MKRHFQTDRLIRIQTALVLGALLSACGGGGGSDSTADSVSTTEGPRMTVTTANYETVGTESVNANSNTTEVGSTSSMVGVAQQPAPRLAAFGMSYLAQAVQALQEPATLVGASQTKIMPCQSGGSITVTANDQNANNKVDAGDSGAFTFNDCQNDGSTISGTMSFTFNSVSGSTSSTVYSVDSNISLDHLRIVSSAGTVLAHGSMRVATSRTAYRVGRDVVTAQALGVKTTVGSRTLTQALNDYVVQTTYTTSEMSVTSAGKVTSSELGGNSFVVSTPLALRQRYTDSYPYTGRMLATGTTGRALLEVLDATQVRISYDADGDGTYEQSTTRTWASIQ